MATVASPWKEVCWQGMEVSQQTLQQCEPQPLYLLIASYSTLFSMIQKKKIFIGMYRIFGSYPVIRPIFHYLESSYPVCYSIIQYPDGYHAGMWPEWNQPDTG